MLNSCDVWKNGVKQFSQGYFYKVLSLIISFRVLSFETGKNTKSHCKSLLISSATILIFIESENLISIVLDF